MKVFVLAPRENWICDRLVSEWYENFPEYSTKDIDKADIIWLLAGWCWQHIHPDYLMNKKVVVTEHHIVPEKFIGSKLQNFYIRDKFVNCYHTPNDKTKKLLHQLTYKDIKTIPYWLNDKFWVPLDRTETRKKLNIPNNDFCIGSFQRDTEGSDLKTPKLEKGPDLFCDYIERIYKDNKNLHILLGGWRRQYVMKRLDDKKIKYTFFEKASLETLRDLYSCCDLYIVGSRHEGGPQAIIEASAMNVPIISTDVGIANKVLSKNCIVDIKKDSYFPSKEDIKICKSNVEKLKIKDVGQEYLKLFESVMCKKH